MRNLTNIEPSSFRHGEYVGYAAGVWHITRRKPSGWHCRKRDAAGYLNGQVRHVDGGHQIAGMM